VTVSRIREGDVTVRYGVTEMTTPPWLRSRWYAGLLVVLAVSGVLLAAELANRRFAMVDFEVFHRAGGRILAGENLYRHVEDGFYEWKYAPPGAFLFAPFALLPLFPAKVAWWLFLGLVIALNLLLCVRLATPDFRAAPSRTNRLVLLAALATAVHLHLELHLGQVNQVILLLFLLMATAIVARRPAAFGAAFAASLALKPFALILAPYLLLTRRWRELAAAALATAALALAPLVVYPPAALAAQYAGWRGALADELAKKADLLAPANHTLASLLARYTPLRLLAHGPGGARAIQLGTLAALAALVLWFVRRGRGLPRPAPAEVALLVALVPLIAFTNYNAFGATMFAATILLSRWEALPGAWRGVTVAGLVLVGGNVYDLWGRRAFRFLDGLSLVAVGGALLVLALARDRAAQAAQQEAGASSP
jgi:hypothetical protein